MSEEKKRYLVARLFESGDYEGGTRYVSEDVVESGDICELTESEAKQLQNLGHRYSERYFAIQIVPPGQIRDAIRRAVEAAIEQAASEAARVKRVKDQAKKNRELREAKAIENAERLLKSKGKL